MFLEVILERYSKEKTLIVEDRDKLTDSPSASLQSIPQHIYTHLIDSLMRTYNNQLLRE
jgi:hypothetical protein